MSKTRHFSTFLAAETGATLTNEKQTCLHVLLSSFALGTAKRPRANDSEGSASQSQGLSRSLLQNNAGPNAQRMSDNKTNQQIAIDTYDTQETQCKKRQHRNTSRAVQAGHRPSAVRSSPSLPRFLSLARSLAGVMSRGQNAPSPPEAGLEEETVNRTNHIPSKDPNPIQFPLEAGPTGQLKQVKIPSEANQIL